MKELFLRRPLTWLTVATLAVLFSGSAVLDRGWPVAEGLWMALALPLLAVTTTWGTWRLATLPFRHHRRRVERAQQEQQRAWAEDLAHEQQRAAVERAVRQRQAAAEREARHQREAAEREVRRRRAAEDLEEQQLQEIADEQWRLARALEEAEVWAEDPTTAFDMPFQLNPPPGWTAPAGEWLPARGWEPPRAWPAVPDGWQLWERTVPRRRHVPRDPYDPAPTWTTHAEDLDDEGVRAAVVTQKGRQRLLREATQIRKALTERRRTYALELEDRVATASRRGPWHPLEHEYGLALDAADLAVSEAVEAVRAGAADEAVARWRVLHEWLDEVADADAERTAEDRSQTRSALLVEFALDEAAADAAWKQAERLAAVRLSEWGFSDARVTGDGTDRGVDVTSRALAAQVKYWDKPIGRPALQQLVGAAGGRLTAFFSRSGFTAQAVEEADRLGMALFRITLPSAVVPVNEAARRLQA